MTTRDDDLPPADPASALRLIEQQRAEAIRQLGPDPRLVYWPWGIAWLIGFGLLFLRFPAGGRPVVGMPDWLPLTALLVLLVAAAALTTVAGAKAYRQVSGNSARRGAWYGLTWSLGFATLMVTASRVSDSLPPDLAGLLWSASAVGLVGALHMAGGAVWLDRGLFRLGIWITVTNIVGVIAGPGWHSLVVSLAGGGMLVAGVLASRPRPVLP